MKFLAGSICLTIGTILMGMIVDPLYTISQVLIIVGMIILARN